MARISVVLPAPFGPSTPMNSPRLMAKTDVGKHVAAADRERHMVELDDAAGRGHEVGLGQRLGGGVKLAQHPGQVSSAGRGGFGHADDGDMRGARQIDEMRHQIAAAPACCRTARALLRLFQLLLELREVARAGLGVVHDGELEALVVHFQTERGGHVAEYRLGRRHRRARIFAADGRDLFVERCERGEKGFEPRRIFVLVRRIGRGKRCGERAGHGRHGARVVPEVRIVAGLLVHRDRRRR